MRKAKYLLLGVIGVAVLGLTGCGSKKVDVTDYVSVEFTGVDGDGKAMCNVDAVGLEQALAGDDDGQISQEEFQKLGWITQFEMGLTYDLDKDSKLSNGDKVTVTVKYNEKLAKENKVKVTGDKKEFKVEGLKEAVEVDAFAKNIFDTDSGVVLEYRGASPMASLIIGNKCTNEPESMIVYKAEMVSGSEENRGWLNNEVLNISNGDEIKITAELPADAAEKGYILKKSEKTITVEGLDTYVTNLSQLNETDRKNVENKLRDFFEASAAKSIEFHGNKRENASLDTDIFKISYNNFNYTDDVFTIKDKNIMIVPFTVGFDMKGMAWWERPLDGITEVSFEKVYGYMVISDLKVDAEGNAVLAEDLNMKMGEIYESKDALKTEILGTYGL